MGRIIRRLSILIALFALCCGEARAAAQADPVSVGGVWAAMSRHHPNRAYVYMTLWLRHGLQDRLIGASTPAARSVDLLLPRQGRRRLHLDKVDAIEISSDAPTVMQPRGPHLILRGVTTKLQPGQSIPVTLTFEKLGARTVSATVLKVDPAHGMPQLPHGIRLD